MIKPLYIFILIFMVSGCMSVSLEPETTGNMVNSSVKPLFEIHRIKPGMTQKEIRALIGPEIIIGYQALDAIPERLEPIKIPQPFRQENFTIDDTHYHVMYYIGYVHKSDGMVSEDELIPLIFEGDMLIGKGAEDLYRIRRR